MCGRYSLEFDEGFFTRYKTANTVALKSHYNVAPSQLMPTIVRHSPNSVELMLWGLIPFWEQKKEKPKGLINLRDDTIVTKSWAHRYLQSQRCLVPATGFYEWKKTPDGKVPYYIHLKTPGYYSFAGLYSSYTHPISGKSINTYSIITTTPNSLMQSIHQRMPAILSPADEDAWLNPDLLDFDQLKRFLKPYPANQMEAYPVPTRVNSPAHNTPDVIKPLSIS
jgi:putative SOS response-associated peptidase YedK